MALVELKVSKTSIPNRVASAIVGNLKDNNDVEIKAIGAASLNQTVKAIAVANDFLAEDDFFVAAVPEFVEVQIEGNERTAIKVKILVIKK